MNCNACIKINPIPSCGENWQVGEVDISLEGEVLVYELKNIATGRTYIGLTEPVSSGIVEISLPEDLTDLMDHVYELTFYDNPPSPDPLEITIGEERGCCVEITVRNVATEELIEFSTANCPQS